MLDELIDGRKLWEPVGVAHQVEERNERVSLAPAVGQLELADRFLVFSSEAREDVLRQLPQVEGRIG